jgi:hypothetical protein
VAALVAAIASSSAPIEGSASLRIPLRLAAHAEQMAAPPAQAFAAPAASIAALGQVPVGYWASDYCRYYQSQDGTWWSDVCARTVPGTNQWGYQPNVGVGRPPASFLALFDTTEPQFTTVRLPNDYPFSTNPNLGWVRTFPGEPNRVDWLIRNNLDGQLHWLTSAQLANELQAGRGPNWGFGSSPTGPAPGSAAANPANTAVLTQLSMSTVNAMNAPATALLTPKCVRGEYCF